MDTILPTMTAMFGANLLTIMFVYGLWKLRNVYDDRDAKPLALASVIIPALFAAAGFWLYG